MIGSITVPDLHQLLEMKWLEPISAIFAGCELARRGEIADHIIVVDNLRNYFAGIPDTEALAKLAGLPFSLPEHPPLILNGFLALGRKVGNNRAPDSAIDYRGPWTVWLGDAVALETTPPTEPHKRRGDKLYGAAAGEAARSSTPRAEPGPRIRFQPEVGPNREIDEATDEKSNQSTGKSQA